MAIKNQIALFYGKPLMKTCWVFVKNLIKKISKHYLGSYLLKGLSIKIVWVVMLETQHIVKNWVRTYYQLYDYPCTSRWMIYSSSTLKIIRFRAISLNQLLSRTKKKIEKIIIKYITYEKNHLIGKKAAAINLHRKKYLHAQQSMCE